MQEELNYGNAIPSKVALEGIDILKAILPDMFRYHRLRQLLVFENLTVDAHHKHFLVIGTVENADVASLGPALRGSPKVVVVQFFFRRRLEGPHVHSLRIYARHDVLDRSILPGRVHALNNQQQAPTVLRRENVLEAAQFLDATPSQF